jgi:hypothetical protein
MVDKMVVKKVGGSVLLTDSRSVCCSVALKVEKWVETMESNLVAVKVVALVGKKVESMVLMLVSHLVEN